MRRKILMNKLSALLLVTLFSMSFIIASSTAAFPESTSDGSSMLSDLAPVDQIAYADEGTNVNWYTDSGSHNDTWTWQNNYWLFGPAAAYEMHYLNGSLIEKDEFVPLNEEVKFVIKVPNDMLRGADLQSVNVYAHLTTMDMDFDAGFDFNYYSGTPDSWYGGSHASNYTSGYELPPYLSLSEPACSSFNDGTMHFVEFRITFNPSTPVGLYYIDVNVQDSTGNMYPLYSPWSNDYGYYEYAIGIPRSEAFSLSYHGGYTVEKYDLDGEPLYSATRGKDFIYRLNISGNGDLAYAYFDLFSMGSHDLPINVSGPHTEIVTKTGGWVYDPDIQIYYYNESIEFETEEDVFGDYIEYDFSHSSPQVNITRRVIWWNNISLMDEVVTVEEPVSMQVYYLYNFTSSTFDVVYGATYYDYPSDTFLGYDVMSLMKWYTESVDNAPFLYYDLNMTRCQNYTIDGTVVLEFAGHFTDSAPKGTLFSIYENVYDKDGMWYGVLAGDMGNSPMTSMELTQARDVVVESPVTIANLKNTDDSPVYGYFFPAEQGEPFKVEASLQGGADIAGEIDGALIKMDSHTSFWNEDEWGSSNLYYKIAIEKDGSTSFQAWNVTTKTNRTYGLHPEWDSHVLVTDWHWEYNETLGEDVFVYGDHYVGQDVMVEGYYWEYYYYNQLTSEWIPSQDWYRNNFYSEMSEMTRVTVDFASISDLSYYIADGDFYFEFLLNFTEEVPNSSFWWDFQFGSMKWYDDESSPEGYFDVATWTKDWVYSFDYLDEDVLADNSLEIGVFNSSIPGVSDWLKVREDPYITIDDVNYPIVTKQVIDNEYDVILFDDYPFKYYELLNGTKVYVYSEQAVWIYNVTIPGQGMFLSTQKEAEYWCTPTQTYHGWWDIYGNAHAGTNESVWRYGASVEVVHISDYVEAGYWVRIGLDTRLDVLDNPINDPRTGTYYIIDTTGERYDYKYFDGCDQIFYEGMWQPVSWSEMSYEADYLGSPVFVPSWSQIQEQWFTVEGHHEMPYPGAMADWWGVQYTTSLYSGKVKTSKTVVISGEPYLLGGDPDIDMWPYELYNNNHTGLWVMYNSINYTLDGRRMFYLDINGTEIWQPQTDAATFDYGFLEGRSLVSEGYLTVPNTYFVNSWYNDTGKYYNWTVTLANGTTFSCEPRYLLDVFLVDVEGELVYTRNFHPNTQQIGEHSVAYIDDLDGTRHYMTEWRNVLPVFDAFVALAWEIINNGTEYHYMVNGTEYMTYEQPWSYFYMFTNGTGLVGKYFDPWGSASYPFGDQASRIFSFDYKGTAVNATAKLDYIFKVGLQFGRMKTYGLTPINSVTLSNFREIIVGIPEWSLWGLSSWSITESGALDLDGAEETTHDQYYVLEEYASTNGYTSEWDRMWVDLLWDPNGTIFGDEMHTHSWMGVETYGWSYQWQQTYYWFHADDMTPVSSVEMDVINATITNPDGTPKPGYWDISHTTNNVTWEDILAEAIANGWDWYSQEEQTWTWLSFGLGQDYGVGNETSYSSINLRYEYSGLMLWEDANNNSIMDAYSIMDTSMENPGDSELTHYFIPDSVGTVSFVTPGAAYGVSAPTGDLLLGVEDEVAWGVTFTDVNGTTFPFNAYAYWDWYGGVVTGSDLRTFDERPTKITIDEISFLVHFQGVINTTEGATSNYATIKVDNTVGQWDIDMIGGVSNLEGKSLSLNYLADVSTSQFMSRDVGVTQEETIVSDRFEIGDDNARFAEMIIGGVTYEWAADPYTAYNVTSQTTPFSTFTSAYESESGQSATSWSFTSTQYYVSIGFPYWDGYYVYQDPIFVAYVSNSGGDYGGEVGFSSLGISPSVPSSTDAVTVSVDIESTIGYWDVQLQYSTDGYNFENSVGMWADSPNHWVGDIPPYPEDQQIWYKVVVHADSGSFESEIKSYIVGQGSVTNPTMPTTSPRPTGPVDPIELSAEMLIMLGGIVAVVVVLGVMAKRRK